MVATNLAIDPELLDHALAVGGARTKKETVTIALQGFIARRERANIGELFGILDWADGYDYKRDRAARDTEAKQAKLLVDTSVWSLALRRDAPDPVPEVATLREALSGGEDVATTGMILLELLRGAVPQSARSAISRAFDSLLFLEPTRADYESAADLANDCRARGVQLGSVDALIAQLAIRHELTLLTTDRDFVHAARCVPVRVWEF